MNDVREPTKYWRNWLIPACYLVATGMVLSLSAILLRVLEWLSPGYRTHGLVFMCALLVMEAFFSFWLIKRLPTAQRQIIYYRGTELLLLLVGLKLFAESRLGFVHLRNNLLLWPVQFPFNILTSQFLLTALPALAAWWFSNLFAADLSRLTILDISPRDIHSDSTPVHVLILRRSLMLGMAAVIIASIPLLSIFNIARPIIRNMTPLVVTYFILGIILVSLTRYLTLDLNWSESNLNIPVQIPRRWLAFTTGILATLMLVIGLLPTGFGMGLFDTLNAVTNILSRVALILYALIMLILSLPARLLAGLSPNIQLPNQGTRPPIENLPPSAAVSGNWDLFKSIFLWTSLIVLFILALRQYIAFHQDMADELRRFRPLRWFITILQKIKSSLQKINHTVIAQIKNKIKQMRRLNSNPSLAGEMNYIHLHRLAPRQKVIFYYLAMIRRAREIGMPRHANHTPYEYARSLSFSLKEEKENIETMTQSFVEARYSQHLIQAKTARQVEEIWAIFRKALRRIRRSREGGSQN